MSAFHKYKWLSLAHKCHLKVNFKIAASNIHTKIASFMLKATLSALQKEPPCSTFLTTALAHKYLNRPGKNQIPLCG